MTPDPHTPFDARTAVPTGGDRARQVIVSLAAIVAVVGALVGSGVIGGVPMQEAADGAFAADATLIAPAGPAFAIWSAIYAGLVAYAIWQWTPSAAEATRYRRTAPWVVASMILNAAWLLAVQAELLWLTVVIMVLLLVSLIVAFLHLRRHQPLGVIDTIVSDGTIGLYLGWVMVATAANVAAVLVATATESLDAAAAEAWAVAVVAAVGLIAIAFAVWNRGRLAPSTAVVWGLSWIAVARLTGEPESAPTTISALIAAALVAVVTIITRLISARSVRRTGRPRT